jgi:sugar lactone lactonase YvrE
MKARGCACRRRPYSHGCITLFSAALVPVRYHFLRWHAPIGSVALAPDLPSMKKNLGVLLAIVVVWAFTSCGIALTIPVSEDTYSIGGRITPATSNSGLLPVDINRRAFVYFSLEEVPTDVTVRFARLRIYTPSVRVKGNGVAIYKVTGEWNELAPPSFEPSMAQTPLGIAEPSRLGSRRFLTFDVTDTVQEWITSKTPANRGFAILPVTSGTGNSAAVLAISAKEGPASGLPVQLEIELEPGSSSNRAPLITSLDDFNRVLKSSLNIEFLRSIKPAIFGALSPIIASQPALTISGTSAFLTVGATTDSGTLFYQWFKDGAPVGAGTSASLRITEPFGGSYSVTVDNGLSPVASQIVSLDPQQDSYSWSTLAGVSSVGSSDGVGSLALFSLPRSVAVDPAGNIFVADTWNHTIRKVTPDGSVSTLAGSAGSSGFNDGIGASARFRNPFGVAADAEGNIFVADSGNHRIRKIRSDRTVSTIAGSGAPDTKDGFGTGSSFLSPLSVAVDPTGTVYVAENTNHVIRKISTEGQVTTLAGSVRVSGSSDGAGAQARFNAPRGLAVNASGDVFVSDNQNRTIRCITSSGKVTTLAGRAGSVGSQNGIGAEASFYSPLDIAVDKAGDLLVADDNALRKIDRNGVVTTIAGLAGFAGYQSGAGSGARFSGLYGVAVTHSGTVVVSDNKGLRKVSVAREVSYFAGATPGSNDGPISAARFAQPSGVVVDRNGTVFVADRLNHTIRKISEDGSVSTFAGSPLNGGTSDGSGASARFLRPRQLARDASGTLYVADTGNHSIRKITGEGIVTTLAGSSGSAGQSDGIGTSAMFNGPYGVATDKQGNVFVADTGNHSIRKISSSGGVTTLAGSSGFAGSTDGIGSAASFRSPNSLVVAPDGNLYVADTSNSLIRKVTPEGVVTTVAGRFYGARISGSQDGVFAWFSWPMSITADDAGNLFVTEGLSNSSIRIRKITRVGVVSTIGGGSVSGSEAYGAKDGVSNVARFANPAGIALGLNNKLYVVDMDANTIRVGERLEK